MDGFCAPDSHHSTALNCQQLSDLWKYYSDAFGLIASEFDTLSVPVLSHHAVHVSVCYILTQIHSKYFHFEPKDKHDFFCLLQTLHAILLKIKTTYHKASHSARLSGCQRTICVCCQRLHYLLWHKWALLSSNRWLLVSRYLRRLPHKNPQTNLWLH